MILRTSGDTSLGVQLGELTLGARGDTGLGAGVIDTPYATFFDASLGVRVANLTSGTRLATFLGLLVNELAKATEVDARACY